MKTANIKRSALALLCVSTVGLVMSCSDDEKRVSGAPATTPGSDAGPGGGGNDGGPVNNGVPVEISGDVSTNMTLSADKNYLLKGVVFVKDGATLTIPKGTTIKGDNATKAVLVVQPGGKLMAEGTADEPIVFTSQANEGSRKAGDWGGLILLGRAKINVPGGSGAVEGITTGGTYGGTNDDDSSGVLRYVRIEYSGVQLSPNNEVNGVTFGGVGRGTIVDHVQVRHTLDDCFEFFGGTVNAKYLACQYNQDDGLDWDLGYTGKVQFFVLQQDPEVPDDTNGFEGDNDDKSTANLPFSEPTIYNATLCGHNKDVAKQQYAMLLRRNTKAHIFNTVALGFEAGVDVRDGVTATNAKAGSLDIKSSLFFGSVGTGIVTQIAYPETGGVAPNMDNDDALDEAGWILATDRKNDTTDPQIAGCFSADAPVFGPAVSLTMKAAPPPNDGFFDPTAAYVGAFKDATDTWATTGKWAVWKAK